jgi:glucose-1-phosphate cytidylyltransferase
MKVVLFCGGYGMRTRDGVSDLPKPMVQVGPRPLLWRVMRYYAHFGHTDSVLRRGRVDLLRSAIGDWTVTFVHTGLESPIGERPGRVRPHRCSPCHRSRRSTAYSSARGPGSTRSSR